tara:strand:- start:8736 stop:9077 length:342 start_codon:yes stop_codon:yes gene_type:complete
MSWLDTAIESVAQDIEVDVSHLPLGINTIMVQPLSTSEYQVLKQMPEVSKHALKEDRDEALGLQMVALMMAKCDSSVSWAKLKKLPISTLGQLSTAIMSAIGSANGGGVLGEL